MSAAAARYAAALELVSASDQLRVLQRAGMARPADADRVVAARCRFMGVPVPREFNRWGNR